MKLSILLNVLNELDRVQHAPSREFVEFPLSSVKNEFFFLNWQLFTSICHDRGKLLAVV